MPTLVIGYNVESGGDPAGVTAFLENVRSCHEEAEAPCTLYLREDVVKKNRKEIVQVARSPLFDLQITVRGPLKTVCQVAEGDTTVWPAADLAATRNEIREAKQIISDLTGREVTGLSDSLGAYRGLQDRPDILEILDAESILFCRTYARNQFDWQPVEFNVEPFWYTFQGYGQILEFPSQGWQQAIIRKIYGWEERDSYIDYVSTDADEAASRDGLVWSYWAQDWSALREDEELTIMSKLIEQACRCGYTVASQSDAYIRLRDEAVDE